MVSWSDETSDPASMPACYDFDPSLLDGTERPPPRPKVLDDPDFTGFGIEEDVGCNHGLFASRRVSYEGTNIGRRFFSCGNPEELGGDCGFRQWVDPEWPPTLNRALTKLWEEVASLEESFESKKVKLSMDLENLHVQKREVELDKALVEAENLSLMNARKELLEKEKNMIAILVDNNKLKESAMEENERKTLVVGFACAVSTTLACVLAFVLSLVIHK